MPSLFQELARFWPRPRTAPRAPAEQKASRTGPLIAIDTLARPVWTPRDYEAFAREGYMQNAIVYRAVRMIAEAAASVPLLVYEGESDAPDHPLALLLGRPSPDHTAVDFFEAWYGYLLVAGNAYVEAVGLAGKLRELHALRPDRMKVVPGPEGWPEAYEYTAAGHTVRFEDEPVPRVRPILHVRLFHPTNDHYGMSPIEAAAVAIDTHNTAAEWNKALLDNSARPSGALVYGGADGRMTAEQFERLKSELEAGYEGAANAGRPLLLEGGLDWKPLSLSPKDMDFLAAKNSAAREIALALGVPPMLLGIPGDNTFSDDAHDPGGPTNLGITLAEYASWRRETLSSESRARLVAELKRLPHEAAAAIYRARYWDAGSCADLPKGVSLMHFDAAVNHGLGTAARILQEAAGAEIDGEIGPLTRAAVRKASRRDLLTRYADLRRARYRALPHFWRFGRGWLARVETTLSRALERAGADPVPRPSNPTEGDTTMTTDTPSYEAKWWGNSLTIWGAIVSGLATVAPIVGPILGINLSTELVRDAGSQVSNLIQIATALAGTVMTILGRARASQPLVRKSFNVKL